eukprot:517935_1
MVPFNYYKFSMIILTAVSFISDYIRIYFYFKDELSQHICSAQLLLTGMFYILFSAVLVKAFKSMSSKLMHIIPVLIPITLPIALYNYMTLFIKSKHLTSNRSLMSPEVSSQSLLYPITTNINSYDSTNIKSKIQSTHNNNNTSLIRDFLFLNVIISPKLKTFNLRESAKNQHR